MTTTDSVFQRALSNMLTEIFDGPPGQEAYVLNPGDPGLLRQLDTIEALAASKRPMPGKNDDCRPCRSPALRPGHPQPLGYGRGEPVGRRRLEWQLATHERHRRSVANTTRGSASGSRQMAKNGRDAHELGRHGRCRCPLHRRPHGVSRRGHPANPRGAEGVAANMSVSRRWSRWPVV